MPGRALCLLSVLVLSSAFGDAPTPAQLEFFEGKVRPLLVKHCYECHSSEAKKVKGDLLLDTRAGLLKGGESGPAIVPGDPEKSLLIQAVRHAEADLKMPKQKLAEHEVVALAEWVKMGAPDPRTGAVAASPAPRFDWEEERKHWAYKAVSASGAPETPNSPFGAPISNAIDVYIGQKLAERGLHPLPAADARTLIRRIAYDLTGLPPTPAEVENFVGAAAQDRERALTELVDRLLATPHYGERWGRHWMDLVRYADTAGDNSDYPVPQLWRYRNYVIDAFNSDKPFDQFIREQIAGDLLPAASQEQRNEQIIATGYLALSRRFGSVVDRYPQHLTIEDTIDNLGKTFLGLSLACARCHDHKFDAISQRDYFALYGMFESTRYAFPGIELLKIQKDFVPLLAPDELDKALGSWRDKERELKTRLDALSDEAKALGTRRDELKNRVATATGEDKEKGETELREVRERYAKVRKQLDGAAKPLEALQKERPPIPDAYAVQDGKPADARVHLKGEPERLGEPVPRRWLELFGGEPVPAEAAKKSSGRLHLAEWIANARNPLTARVIVNRIWHYHFGAGLVKTPNDFGVRGQPPSHPELLDYLAHRFMAEGWSIKKLHKQILLSHTYQLSSGAPSVDTFASTVAATDAWKRNSAEDPDNVFHWRFQRRRLDAESLRDSLLALSGTLDSTPLKEPHPFPPPAKWEFTQHHPFRASYPSNRRSVYLMTSRLTASPFFQTFDGPDRNASTAARDSSVTTVQALYFLNDEFVHEQAERFAERILKEAPDDAARVDRAFALILLRPPSADERARIAAFLAAAGNDLQRVSNAPGKREEAAWTSIARALFRTNEFLYID